MVGHAGAAIVADRYADLFDDEPDCSSVSRETGEPSQATTWGAVCCWIWSCVSQEGWTAASVGVRVW